MPINTNKLAKSITDLRSGLNKLLSTLKTYNDMTIPERAAFLEKNKEKIGLKFGYKMGLDGKKHYAFEYLPESELLSYLNSISRNLQYISMYGEDSFKSMNRRDRDAKMEKDVVDAALKEKYADDPNYEYFDKAFSTEGKKELLSKHLSNNEIKLIIDMRRNRVQNMSAWDLVKAIFTGDEDALQDVFINKNPLASKYLSWINPLYWGTSGDHFKDAQNRAFEISNKLLEEIKIKDRQRRYELAQKLIPTYEKYYRDMLDSGQITRKDIDLAFKELTDSNRFLLAYKETLSEDEKGLFGSNSVSGSSDKIKMISTYMALMELGGDMSAADWLDGTMEEMVHTAQGAGGRAWNSTKGLFTGTVAAIGQVLAALGNIGVVATLGEKGLTEWLQKQYNPETDSPMERFFNNKYWNDVDKYGTFDTGDHVRADALGGLSENVNIYDPSSKGNILSEETLHSIVGMGKFLLSLAIMNYLSGGTAGAISKIGGKVGTILSNAASTAGLLAGSASIGNAYAQGVFLETRLLLLDDLDRRTDMKVNEEALKYQNSSEFKTNVHNTALQLKDLDEYQGMSLDQIEGQVAIRSLNEFKDKKREEYVSSEDYQNDLSALDKASTDAFITSVSLEALKYLPLNAGVRTWLLSPTQRAMIDKMFTRKAPNRYSKEGFLITHGDAEGIVTKGYKFKTLSKPVLKNMFYSGFTNYTDETASGIAMGLGLSNYNDYVKNKLSPEEYKESMSSYYGVMADMYNPMTSAVQRSMTKLALTAFIVGAGGTVFGPAFTGRTERANARKLAYDSETGLQKTTLKWNMWDKIGNFPIVFSPLLKQIAMERTKYRQQEAHAEQVNNIIKRYRDNLDKDILKATLLRNIEIQDNTSLPEDVIAAESNNLMAIVSTINQALSNPEVGESPIVLKTILEIRRLAESVENVTDEDVASSLFRPSVYRNTDSLSDVAEMELAKEDLKRAESGEPTTAEEVTEQKKQEYKESIHQLANRLLKYAERVKEIKNNIQNLIGQRLISNPELDDIIDSIVAVAFQKEFLEEHLRLLLGLKEGEELKTTENILKTIRSKSLLEARLKALQEEAKSIEESLKDLEKLKKLKKDSDIGNIFKDVPNKIARMFRKMYFKSAEYRLNRQLDLIKRELNKLKNHISNFINDEFLPEVSAKEIMEDFSVIDKWEILNPKNRRYYSEEQGSLIDSIIGSVDYNLATLETAYNIARMINSNAEALATMKENPDMVQAYNDVVKAHRNEVLRGTIENYELDRLKGIYILAKREDIAESLKETGVMPIFKRIINWLKSGEHPEFPTELSVDEFVEEVQPIIALRESIQSMLYGREVMDGDPIIITDKNGIPLTSRHRAIINTLLAKFAKESKTAEEFRDRLRVNDKDTEKLKERRDKLNSELDSIKLELANMYSDEYLEIDNKDLIYAINRMYELDSILRGEVKEIPQAEVEKSPEPAPAPEKREEKLPEELLKPATPVVQNNGSTVAIKTVNIVRSLNSKNFDNNSIIGKLLKTIQDNLSKDLFKSKKRLHLAYHEEATREYKETLLALGKQFNELQQSIIVIETLDGDVVGILPVGDSTSDANSNGFISAVRLVDKNKLKDIKLEPGNSGTIYYTHPDVGKDKKDIPRTNIKDLIKNSNLFKNISELKDKIKLFFGNVSISNDLIDGHQILQYRMTNGTLLFLFVQELLDTVNNSGKTFKEFLKENSESSGRDSGSKFSEFNSTTKLALARFITNIRSNTNNTDEIQNCLFDNRLGKDKNKKTRIFGAESGDNYLFNVSRAIVVDSNGNLVLQGELGIGEPLVLIENIGELYKELDSKIQEAFDQMMVRLASLGDVLKWLVNYLDAEKAGTVDSNLSDTIINDLVDQNILYAVSSSLDSTSPAGLNLYFPVTLSVVQLKPKAPTLINTLRTSSSTGTPSNAESLTIQQLIEENSLKVHLTSDESGYTVDGVVDGLGNPTFFHRVTKLIQKTMKKEDEEKGTTKSGQGIGNLADALWRDVASGRIFSNDQLKQWSARVSTHDMNVWKEIEEESKLKAEQLSRDESKYPNIRQNLDLQNLITIATQFIVNLMSLGRIIFGDGVKVYGIVKDSSGREIPVAGTLDLVFFDPIKKKLHVYDMKTLSNLKNNVKNNPDWNINKWSKQLKLYVELLKLMYPGVSIGEIGILGMDTDLHVDAETPVKVDPVTNKVTVNRGKLSLIDITMDPTIPELLPQEMGARVASMTVEECLNEESVKEALGIDKGISDVDIEDVKKLPTDELFYILSTYDSTTHSITFNGVEYIGDDAVRLYNNISQVISQRNYVLNQSKKETEIGMEDSDFADVDSDDSLVTTQSYTYEALETSEPNLFNYMNNKYGKEMAKKIWDEVCKVFGENAVDAVKSNCL